jgi:SSS family solute:Na+ symporter
MQIILSFLAFVGFVAIYVVFRLRKDKLSSRDGYFLGGRSLTGVVIATSILLANISTEHLVGMNGNSYRYGFIIIGWEYAALIGLVAATVFFIPTYLKMGLTTIPQYLEERFDGTTRTLVALFLMISFVVTLLPIVLYTGAINIESIFNISEVLNVSETEGLWITVICLGVLGSAYAIFGGLKAVAYSDTINGIGLFIAGIMVPVLALWDIGDGQLLTGLNKVFQHSPEKFNVIGPKDSILPFSALFTGMLVAQLYFWGMNQTIIQKALGAKSLVEAQKGLLFTGVLKLLVPIIIVLPGVIGYYYFGDMFYEQQDTIYPQLVKKVLPLSFVGFFAAVIMGAVFSTYNSVLNGAATISSVGIYKRLINKEATERKTVIFGKIVSAILAVFGILTAPLVAGAPEGLYQLLQQLNGIFFIPIGSIMLAGFFIPRISAIAAKTALFVGLMFYILTAFIFKVDIHFVHLWGIEFVLNMIVMFVISGFYPNTRVFKPQNTGVIEVTQWKYTKPFAAALLIIAILIYIWLGHF